MSGQGQRSGSRSRSRSNFWHAAVDIRGSALPSAAKSEEESSVRGVCLCVEYLRRCSRSAFNFEYI